MELLEDNQVEVIQFGDQLFQEELRDEFRDIKSRKYVS